jgi:predicted SAM-dependent methyltransferase
VTSLTYVAVEVLGEPHYSAIEDGQMYSPDAEIYMPKLIDLYGSYVKVELGPGRISEEHKRGYITIGLNPSADYFCDIYMDLEDGLPFDDETVDEIYSNQFLEHISREKFIYFMNEQWRVLKPGGFMVHSVPTWDSPWAFADPTHKNWFQPNSFDYFSIRVDGEPFVNRFSDYGIKCAFKTSMKVRPRVDITVRMVK